MQSSVCASASALTCVLSADVLVAAAPGDLPVNALLSSLSIVCASTSASACALRSPDAALAAARGALVVSGGAVSIDGVALLDGVRVDVIDASALLANASLSRNARLNVTLTSPASAPYAVNMTGVRMVGTGEGALLVAACNTCAVHVALRDAAIADNVMLVAGVDSSRSGAVLRVLAPAAGSSLSLLRVNATNNTVGVAPGGPLTNLGPDGWCGGPVLQSRVPSVSFDTVLLSGNAAHCGNTVAVVSSGGAAQLRDVASVSLRSVSAIGNRVSASAAPSLMLGGGALALSCVADAAVVVDIVDSSFVAQRVDASGVIASTAILDDLFVGGGSIQLLSFSDLRLSVVRSLFAGETLLAAAFASLSRNLYMGGGAVQVFVPVGGAQIDLVNSTFAAQSFNVSSSAVGANHALFTGGGALWIFADGSASALSPPVSLTVNGSLARSAPAAAAALSPAWLGATMSEQQFIGDSLSGSVIAVAGGGLLLTSVGSVATSVFVGGGAMFAGQVLLARNNAPHVPGSVASSMLVSAEGGGAIFVGAVTGNATVVVDGAAFRDQLLTLDNRTAPAQVSVRGGGALLCTCSHSALELIVRGGAVFERQIVSSRGTSSTFDNAFGGGALFASADAVSLSVSQAVFNDQQLHASGAVSGGNNFIGGGAFGVVSSRDADVTLSNGTRFSGQLVNVSLASALFNNTNGGGALFVYSMQGHASAVTSGAVFTNQVVDVSDTRSSLGHVRSGGGGVFVVGYQSAACSLRGATQLSGQVVNASATRASGESESGGAGAFVFGLEGSVTVSVAEGTRVADQVVLARGCSAHHLHNGGAGVYVYGGRNGGALLNISDAVFSNQMIDASENAASIENANGGAAVYVVADAYAASVFLRGTTVFADQVVFADACVSQGDNANGGAAIYTYARADGVFVTLAGSVSFAGQAVLATGNSASNGSNVNGGAGLYMNAATSLQLVDYDDSPGSGGDGGSPRTSVAMSAQRVVVDAGAAVHGSNIGGGAGLFALSNAGNVTLQLRGLWSMRGQSVSGVGCVAANGSNAVGGAALHVVALTGSAQIALGANASFVSQSVTAMRCTATHANANGGAALFVEVRHASASVSVARDSLFANQIVNASGGVSQSSENGGGAFFVSSDGGQVSVDIDDGCAFANQTVDSSNTAADTMSANGGGAVYAQSYVGRGTAVVRVRGNVIFANQTVLVDTSNAGVINANGGGALYAMGNATAEVALDGRGALAFVGQLVRANGGVSRMSNSNGGGAVLVQSPAGLGMLTTSGGVTFAGQRLLSDVNRANHSNYNGGAAAYVYGSAGVRVALRNTTCTDQLVSTEVNVAVTHYNNNGGAVLQAVSAADVNIVVEDSVFSGQVLSLPQSTALEVNYNGGGALSAFGATLCSMTVMRSVFDGQTCVVDGSEALNGGATTGGNQNGGGAILLSSVGDVVLAVSGSAFRGQAFRALGSVAAGGFGNINGGGAIGINSLGSCNVSVVDSAFSGQFFNASGNVALQGDNSNGGGALYVYASGNAAVSFAHTQLLDQSVYANDNAAVGQSNLNGGGAVYVNALGVVDVSVEDCSIAGQVSSTNGNAANVSSFNGGGAVYVSGGAGITNVTIGASVFRAQRVLAVDNVALAVGGATYNGGGALYATGGGVATTVVVQRGSVFTDQLVSVGSNVAYFGSNNGGGALMVVSQFGLASAVVRGASLMSGQTVLSSNSAATASGDIVTVSVMNGGGALYVLSLLTSAFARVTERSQIVNQTVVVTNNTAYGGGNFNGGGALYVYATLNSTAVVDDGSAIVGQTVLASANAAQVNLNGGGALFVYGNTTGTVLIGGRATLGAQQVFVNNGTALHTNSNGGGAVFVFSTGRSVLRMRDNSRVVGQLLETIGSSVATDGASNLNGGGGLLVASFEGRVSVVLDEGSRVAQQSLLGNASRVDGVRAQNANGGGGVLATSIHGSVEVFVQNSSAVLDQSVSFAGCSARGSGSQNVNGGAGVYAASLGSDASVFLEAAQVGGQRLDVSNSTAPTNNNGGAGVYVLGLRESRVSASETAFFGQQLVARYLRADMNNNNGGGGVYVNALQAAGVATLRGCTFNATFADVSGNVVSARPTVDVVYSAGLSNINGGAAVYVNPQLASAVVAIADCTFVDANVLAANSSAPMNENGGACLLVNGGVLASVSVENVTFARYSVDVSSTRAGLGNFNGGGAMYLCTSSFGDVEQSIAVNLTHCRFDSGTVNASESSVEASDDVATAAPRVLVAANNNGGGAVYVFSAGSLTMTMQRCHVRVHSVDLSGNRATAHGALFSGGGAVYVFSTGGADATFDSVRVENVSVQLHSVHANVVGLYAGGAGVFVNTGTTANCTFAGVVVNGTVASVLNSHAQDVAALVGGALYVLSREESASVLVRNGTLVANVLSVTLVTAGTERLPGVDDSQIAIVCGGAALYVVSVKGNARLSVNDTQVMLSAMLGRELRALSGSAFVGSGGVMLVSSAGVALCDAVGAAFRNLSVHTVGIEAVGNIVAGGAALFVLGSESARVHVLHADMVASVLSVRECTSSQGSVYAGGGSVVQAVVQPCATSSISLRWEHVRVSGNRATVGSVSGSETVIGGGGVLAATGSAVLEVVIQSGRVENNTAVVADVLPSVLQIGGAGILVRSSTVGRTDSNSITIRDVVVAGNVLLTSSSPLQQTRLPAGVQLDVVGGAGLLLASEAQAVLEGVLFDGNAIDRTCAQCSGGGALLAGQSSMTDVSFTGNSAVYGGGLQINAAVTGLRVLVSDNVAVLGSGGMQVAGGTSACSNCTFLRNGVTSGYGGALSVSLRASLRLDGCTVAQNHATAGGGFLVSDQGSLEVANSSVLLDNVAASGEGGCALVVLHGALEMSGVVLDGCVSTAEGGAVAVFDLGTGSISNAVLRNHVSGTAGGAIALENSAELVLMDALVWNCTAVQGMKSLLEAAPLLQDTAGIAGVGGALSTASSGRVTVVNVVIEQCTAIAGGGFFAHTGAALELHGVTVQRCVAVFGGGAVLEGAHSQFVLNGVKVDGCEALVDGGGVFWTVSQQNDADLSGGAVFLHCSAGRGGAIAVQPDSVAAFNDFAQDVELRVAQGMLRVSGYNNSAAPGVLGCGGVGPSSSALGCGAGGFLFFDLSKLSVGADPGAVAAMTDRAAGLSALLRDLCMTQYNGSNVASMYGDCIASSWYSVRAAFETTAVGGGSAGFQPGSVARLVVWALDVFGQNVTSQGDSLVNVTCTGGVCASGALGSVGVLVVMPARGVTQYSIEVQASSDAAMNATAIVQPFASASGQLYGAFEVPLEVVPCTLGFTLVGRVCVPCPSGSYMPYVNFSASVGSGNASCVPCPPNVECLGGTDVYAVNYFWPLVERDASGVLLSVRCPYDYCARTTSSPFVGAAPVLSGPFCAPGSFRASNSTMCGDCVAGYTEWDGVCVQCAPGQANAPAIVVLVLQLLVYVVAQRLLAGSRATLPSGAEVPSSQAASLEASRAAALSVPSLAGPVSARLLKDYVGDERAAAVELKTEPGPAPDASASSSGSGSGSRGGGSSSSSGGSGNGVHDGDSGSSDGGEYGARGDARRVTSVRLLRAPLAAEDEAQPGSLARGRSASTRQFVSRYSGESRYSMLVFLFQFADLAFYPNRIVPEVLSLFVVRPPSAYPGLGCPFDTGGGYGELLLYLCLPLVYVTLSMLLFALHKVVACLATHVSRAHPASLWLAGGAQFRMYSPGVVLTLLNSYKSVLQVCMMFLACVEGVQVVPVYPGVSCTTGLYRVVFVCLVVLVALLAVGGPLLVALGLHCYRRRRGSLEELQGPVGVLFRPYKAHLFWWEAVALARRAIILALFVGLLAAGNIAAAKLAMAVTVVLFAVVVVLVRPFRNEVDGSFDLFVQLVLLIVIGASYATQELPVTANVSTSYPYVIVCVLVLGTGLLLLLPSALSAVQRGRAVLLAVRERVQRWRREASARSGLARGRVRSAARQQPASSSLDDPLL